MSTEVGSLNSGVGGMADTYFLKKFQPEITCYVCSGYFINPVILECGHNFCHNCLFNSWRDFIREPSCPQCKVISMSKTVIQNKQLAKLVSMIKQLNDTVDPTKSQDRICQQHQEPMKLFCKNDLVLLCSECEQSMEHRAHYVLPLEQAAVDLKPYLLKSIAQLKEERKKMVANKRSLEEEYQKMSQMTKSNHQNLKVFFQSFHQLLDQEELRLMGQFERLLDEISKTRYGCVARIFDDVVSCDRIIHELQEKCQKPALEFLQDLKDIMAGYVESTNSTSIVPITLSLKWNCFELSDIQGFLEGVKENVKAKMQSHYLKSERDVILDPVTAHPRFIVSHKDVQVAGEAQDVYKTPKRFDESLFVLGRKGLGLGRHSWEVHVNCEEDWAVGVAKRLVKRKGPVPISPVAGIWAVGKRRGVYVTFEPPDYPPLPLSTELKRIRVLLNCEGNKVVFFDAVTATYLTEMSPNLGVGEIFFPFFHLSNGQLRIFP